MVRAYSQDTERPYFDIKFNLDLGQLGKELFNNGHLGGGLAHHRRSSSRSPTVGLGGVSRGVSMVQQNRAMRRCNSESIHPGRAPVNIDTLEAAQDGNVLRSPRAGIRRKQIGGNRFAHPASGSGNELASSFSKMRMHDAGSRSAMVRRSKSAAGAAEMGMYREGDPGGARFDLNDRPSSSASYRSGGGAMHATATFHSK